MTDGEKIEFTVEAFTALVSEQQDRLLRGKILRQAMHDSIRRGESPSGYRAKWIETKALEMVKYLLETAKAFDEQHPQDRASVEDLLDILETTQGLFKRKIRD